MTGTMTAALRIRGRLMEEGEEPLGGAPGSPCRRRNLSPEGQLAGCHRDIPCALDCWSTSSYQGSGLAQGGARRGSRRPPAPSVPTDSPGFRAPLPPLPGLPILPPLPGLGAAPRVPGTPPSALHWARLQLLLPTTATKASWPTKPQSPFPRRPSIRNESPLPFLVPEPAVLGQELT